jgi:glycogen synthase
MPMRVSRSLKGHEPEGSVGPLGRVRGPRPLPRRILMTADGVGGVWPYALDLAAGLGVRGIDVTLAVMGPPLLDHQLAEAARRGLNLYEGGYALEWMSDAWDDVDAAGEWLLGLERTLAPDVVHLNGYCHAALPWRAPTLVVGHSCVRSWWQGVRGEDAPPAWETYSRRVADGLRAASMVVAPSAAMAGALDAEYGPIGDITVIPNGSAAPAGRAVAPKQELVFTAGRTWDEAKNVEALCAIAPDLTWPVAVAGETRDPGGLCATGYVNYLGRLPHGEIREWYDRAGIYVLPARYEPFGLSVLEAAAAGCALVLGDIRSLRENWTGAAEFVPPDNRRALAAAIQGLIDDPERRVTLATAAVERARTFTVARMAAAYVDAYQGVMARTTLTMTR